MNPLFQNLYSREYFLIASNDCRGAIVDEALPLNSQQLLDRERLAAAEAQDFEELEAGYWQAA